MKDLRDRRLAITLAAAACWAVSASGHAPGRAGQQATPSAAAPANDDEAAIERYTRSLAASGLPVDEQVRLHLERGRAYARRGRLDVAIADYDAVIRLKPNDSEALTSRADAFAARAAADRRAAFDTWFARGRAHNDAGQYEQAIADNDAALSLDPQSSAAHNNRCISYRNLKQYDRALADCDAGVRLDPKNPVAYNSRGRLYDAQRQYQRAIADYDAAIALNARFVEAYNNRGNAYADLGQDDRAIADYDAVTRLAPTEVEAYNNRASVYTHKGQHDRALAEYAAALRLSPGNATVYFNRGNAYVDAGQRDRAIADYTEAIRLRPNGTSAYFNRADVYRTQREYSKAVADYDAILRLAPTHVEALLNRGIAYVNLGQDARAVTDYTEAIRLKPDYWKAYFRRGVASYALQRFYNAVEDFDRLIKVGEIDGYGAIWHYLARSRAKLPTGDAIERVVTRDPSAWPGPLVAFYRGQMTAERVRAAAAAGAADRRPARQCEAAFYLGEYELALNRLPNARPLLQTAVESCAAGMIEGPSAAADLKALAASIR